VLAFDQPSLTSILRIYTGFTQIMVPKVNEGASVGKGLITAHNTYKDKETGGSLTVRSDRKCSTNPAQMVTDYTRHTNTIRTLVKTDTDCIVTCSVEDSCLLPLVIIPCRATGCCGISIFTAPTVSSPEFLSLVRLDMLEYRACDLPTVTFTTVLQKQSPQLTEQNTDSTENTFISFS